ncbi:unnamed protein product [Blepharisma stoltei]|uniref:Uncharacterized protein n=1 Tax=Blepharisma stoltei TaxID=1481888 RepID=A0AAU9IXC7_9CILI|nr:unnamed protein product [Blepharisma stoltei]
MEPELINNYKKKILNMKEEVIKLNRQIAQAESIDETQSGDRDESLKKQSLLRHCQGEIDELTDQLSKLQETNSELSESCEELKNRIDPLPISDSQLEELNEQIANLEKENEDLKRQNEEIGDSGLQEWENLSPTAANEFFVNLQKKLSQLEQENAALSAKYKKSEAETKRLKENCEKAAARFKNNEDTRSRLQQLEDDYQNCVETEKELKEEIEDVERQIMQKSASTEGQDIRSLQHMISELNEKISQEKAQCARLEKQLQDKQQELRTIKITSNLTVSKTSTKLSNELDLLGKVLADKLKTVREKDKDIAEISLKYEEAKLQLNGPEKISTN